MQRNKTITYSLQEVIKKSQLLVLVTRDNKTDLLLIVHHLRMLHFRSS